MPVLQRGLGHREPLHPRLGVLLLGTHRDGLIVRFARAVPAGTPLRIVFETWRKGQLGRELEFPLCDLLEHAELTRALEVPEDEALRAIGMLLAASDKTVNRTAITPPFSMAGNSTPCPVCGATGPVSGSPRECVISSIGTVVCRGEPTAEAITAGLKPLAHVGDCACPGRLYVVSEPAASRFVLASAEPSGHGTGGHP